MRRSVDAFRHIFIAVERFAEFVPEYIFGGVRDL